DIAAASNSLGNSRCPGSLFPGGWQRISYGSSEVNEAVGLGRGVGVALGDGSAVECLVILDGADAGDAQGIAQNAPAAVGVAESARAVSDAVRSRKVGGKIL